MPKIKFWIEGDLNDPEFKSYKEMAEAQWNCGIIHQRKSESNEVMKSTKSSAVTTVANDKKGGYTRKVIPGQSTLSILIGYLAGKKDKRASKPEIRNEFERVGYKPNSSSSAITTAKKMEWIIEDEYGIITAKVIPTKAQIEAAKKKEK